MIVYETREFIKILRRIKKKQGVRAKFLQDNYYYFTNDFIAELHKLDYVRYGRMNGKKFTTETADGTKGHVNTEMFLGLGERGNYVIDQANKERWAVVREVGLCLLSAIVGGLVTILLGFFTTLLQS
jgi:hypothetical protein